MARIYLDHNASAPLRPEARAAMIAAMDVVGNPSSVHAEGRAAKAIVEQARARRSPPLWARMGPISFSSQARPRPQRWPWPGAICMAQGSNMTRCARGRAKILPWINLALCRSQTRRVRPCNWPIPRRGSYRICQAGLRSAIGHKGLENCPWPLIGQVSRWPLSRPIRSAVPRASGP